MINFLTIVLASMALFVFGCSGPSKDAETYKTNKSTVESGSTDPKSVLDIQPFNAKANSVITLTISDQKLSRSNIHWNINGDEDQNARTVRFTSDTLKKGDIVQAVLIEKDTKHTSNEITILNSPPTIQKARIFPALPKKSSRLSAEVTSHDIDGDYVAYKYSWTHNGKTASEESYFEGDFNRGDTITVEVTPLDNDGPGKSVTLTSSIFNSIPVISEGTHEFNVDLYTYQIAASDPDTDILAFTLEEGPEGMTIDPSSGLISWKTGPDDAGTHEIKVSVTDNNGAKIMVPITTVLSLTE